MIEYETTKIVHKTLHNEIPEYLRGLFTRVSDKCDRELRNSKLDLNLPLLKTSFGQKSFSFRGAKPPGGGVLGLGFYGDVPTKKNFSPCSRIFAIR